MPPPAGLQRRTPSFLSLKRSSSSPSSSSTPTSRVLLSGLACCVSHAWTSREDEGSRGGLVVLVVAYWLWRITGQHRNPRQRSKGSKARSSSSGSVSTATVIALGVQPVAFALSLRYVGPLRSTLVLLCCQQTPWSLNYPSILPPIAAGLVTAIILVTQLSQYQFLSGAILLALSSSVILERTTGPKPNGNTTNKKPYSQTHTRTPYLAAVISAGCLGVLSLVGLVNLPTVDLIQDPGSFLSMLFAGVLTRYFPLTRPSSSGGPKSLIKGSLNSDLLVGSIIAIQSFALPPSPSMLDLFVICPLYLLSNYLASQTHNSPAATPRGPPFRSFSTGQITTNARWTLMNALPKSWRPHLRTILLTPTSSKIFYFLLLNLAYMAVQMGYGVATNSLGLISDAIHMLFDCLGLGVGLWASVAATWKPDGRYTYGYSRVETLSGFANGCFLILISIFIIFEAIQRIIEPPEVSTHQLLLVSSIGLAINLWGMVATGGHHHHGHSHGHSHGQDHSHSHEHDHGHSHSMLPVNDKKEDHRHVQHSSQKRSLSKKVSSHDLRPSLPGHAHRRVSAQVVPLNNGGGQDSSSSESLDHADDPDHSGQHHDHDHTHGCDHGHDHHGPDHHHHSHHPHSPGSNQDRGDDHCDHHHDVHDHHHHHHDHDHGHASSHNHGHSHGGHGHSHAHSHNMRGVFLHVLADTLGSVGVIVSTILIRLTGWTGFDPLASLFIAGLIMASVIPLVIDSAKVLSLDMGPDNEKDVRAALGELSTVQGLTNYSAPRFWPTCEGELVGSIHIHLAPSNSSTSHDPSKLPSAPSVPTRSMMGETIYHNADKVVQRVESILKGKIKGLTELIVQIEGSEERSFCTCMTGG